MKRKEILSYTYNFISLLMDKIENELDSIILFGSVARGDFDEKSDIDLFINVRPKVNTKKMQKIVNSALNEFEDIVLHRWSLRGINLPIKCIIGSLNSDRWSALRREIISSGITVFGRYKELPGNLKQSIIFSFQVSSLEPKDKVKVIRLLYGYKSKKKQKEYKHRGILEEVDGFKLNRGAIAAPLESYQKIYDFFRKNKVKFKVREVWME
ncbi:MAG: nucleotidyltransferase domain-containing protein [Candidatus Aenigmarchaeota archaeon]|nr:nucleotidyltransferase domain-containing protein [Candidatus Aenigmarchaeota archaeon]